MDEERLNQLLSRITVRSDVFDGKPIIRDMRVSVQTVLSMLAQGVGVDELLDDYPNLERDDVLACIAFARESLVRETTAKDAEVVA